MKKLKNNDDSRSGIVEDLTGLVIKRTSLNINLSSRDMSLKGTAGIAALTFCGVGIYQLCRNEPNKKVIRGCAVGTAVFGGAWHYLDRKEKEERQWRENQLDIDPTISNGNLPHQSEDNGESEDNKTSWTGKSASEMVAQDQDINPEEQIAVGLVSIGLINYLVAGASVGKSILMAQIALTVAKGERMAFQPSSYPEAKKMNVIFYRLEDFPTEFYGKYGEAHIFDCPNFKWVPASDLDDNTTGSLLKNIKSFVEGTTQDTLICIDPATKLQDYQHAKFIHELEGVQQKANSKSVKLTFLICAHVDEIDDWKMLTPKNIKGGDGLYQQAGSVFALRKERSEGSFRFIQVLKAPKGQAEPDTVIVCEIVKDQIDERNFNTYLKYVQNKNVKDALPLKPKPNVGSGKKGRKKITLADVKQMKEMFLKGESVAEIARHFDVSAKTIYQHFEKSGINIKELKKEKEG